MTERRDELAANLARVEDRIASACAAAGRPRQDVTLIVVTKTYPASDVRILHGLGVRQVAENRDQDAAPKAAACADLSLSWHFVGQLQTNKVRSVAGYADVVQSVDRTKLVTALSSAAGRGGRELGCLIQVALDAESGERGARGGVAPDGIGELADAVADAPGLRLDGLMTVAPLAGPFAGRQRAAFDRLMEFSSRLRGNHPAANMVSAGMSADLEDAIAAGATHVRVGTAVLGVRPGLG
ncbi:MULTISPECIES: YggS family pyridoxal phosphate-dependent enzyme [unclassified Streptomyces]|uniref:YggS family pyridoxal phosphate-dependent enzyme n=1 Tax=unclassified Streptomyces TaxID=2593676 RepID=UPI002ED39991|nr:YggS family pyridoxal phosphate-dependent enzyme [Streptomyces sp. NBC_00891]WSY04997.1 YggS family pyridoxal phosphate-dependent enzyme [Streptomyces sp. NBC_00890]WSZ06621.1 YggS family pyridoxal phosphate-dependent enzyme [Streptomyces sp. NBC_00869]WSZ25880.1 YggS family pyridoxal phosphate-dependent enzyme [Streptomyces sp. NBC_00870]